MNISIPKDRSGYFARECPKCEGTFKVMPGTGLTNISDCYCAYCGHKDSNDTFWTKEQLEYAKSVALNKIEGDVLRMLKRHEFDHKPRGAFGIGSESTTS